MDVYGKRETARQVERDGRLWKAYSMEIFNEHSELRSPVSYMIYTLYLIAFKLKDTTCTHTHPYIHIRTSHVRIFIHTYIHVVYTCIFTQTYSYIHIDIYIHACIHLHINVYSYIHAYSYIHPYSPIHTYTRYHTHNTFYR